MTYLKRHGYEKINSLILTSGQQNALRGIPGLYPIISIEKYDYALMP